MSVRRICVVLTTRGNYGKMKSTMRALEADPRAELQVVIGGPLLRDDYGAYEPVLKADGFAVAERIDYLQSGEALAAMTQSASRCTALFGQALERLSPDLVVIVADRYEALALAQAALCMNVRIAHLEGGEVSGSIDERIRHAISKLSHIHLAANEDAARRLVRMGEPPAAVHVVGTPSLDLLAGIDLSDLSILDKALMARGRGGRIDLAGGYLVVSQHPVVTEVESASSQYEILVAVVRALGLPVVWVLPNPDAGADAGTSVVDQLAIEQPVPVCVVGSLPLEPYAVLLRNARAMVGNTSSGIREAAFLGTPVVNIGTRQTGRARGRNVVDVPVAVASIVDAARRQIAHGLFSSDALYGDGRAGEKIAAALMAPLPSLDKTIAY
jgi:UDP-hydrolysing UDP-N-acetyl-D-glucosamine 2-epimerase